MFPNGRYVHLGLVSAHSVLSESESVCARVRSDGPPAVVASTDPADTPATDPHQRVGMLSKPWTATGLRTPHGYW
ncbi:Uncharacterised protein [Prescottella equi]|nr:Uncharacterised protein [Prescottella equi]